MKSRQPERLGFRLRTGLDWTRHLLMPFLVWRRLCRRFLNVGLFLTILPLDGPDHCRKSIHRFSSNVCQLLMVLPFDSHDYAPLLPLARPSVRKHRPPGRSGYESTGPLSMAVKLTCYIFLQSLRWMITQFSPGSVLLDVVMSAGDVLNPFS